MLPEGFSNAPAEIRDAYRFAVLIETCLGIFLVTAGAETMVIPAMRLVIQGHFAVNRPEFDPMSLGSTICIRDHAGRNWEDALERGLLSLDDAVHRIKALQ